MPDTSHHCYDTAGNIVASVDGLDSTNSRFFSFDALNRVSGETWQASLPYSGEVMADSPLGYWRLGESGGTNAVDASGNANDGSYTGTYTLGDPSLILDNDTSLAIDSAGSGYVSGATYTGSTITGVEGWMQTDSHSAYRWFLSLHHADNNRFIIGHHTNGTVVVFRNGSFLLASDAVVTSNEPHHIAVWYEAAANKTYMMIDGVVQQNTYTGDLLAITDPILDLGAYRYRSSVWPSYLGAIDEVAIYDTPVTAATFLDRYAVGTTGTAPGGAANAFTYDANGNRLTLDNGTVQTLAYQALSNRLATIDGVSVTHDLAGNRTAEPGGVITYSYDDSGRLASVANGGTNIATYIHNALGQRSNKSTGGSDTVYVYDLFGQLIAEHDGSGTLIRDYVWLDAAPVAQIDAGELFSYIGFDHLNTPRTATDDSQTIVWRWDGDAFGSMAANEDPDGNSTPVIVNLRFPGQYFDAETGFHYNYFRTYDPSSGRYLESDPIGLNGGLNTYGYVSANPLSAVDPFGLFDVIGPCDGLKSFEATAACKKDPNNQELNRRKAYLGDLGKRFGEAIDSEEDCECKEQFQGLYDNWTVTPTGTEAPPGIFHAKTDVDSVGGGPWGPGDPTGGYTQFYNSTFRLRASSIFFHEFAHMTPEVYRMPDPWNSHPDSPRETTADKISAQIRYAMENGGSLCR